MTRPDTRLTRVSVVVVVAAAAIATTWAVDLLWRRIDGLASAAYDLGFFQQVVWSVGVRGTWSSSFQDGSFLGLHFSPILVIPAVIQGLTGPDPHVLSAIHGVSVGTLVIAAFLFLRAALRPARWSPVLAAGIALWIPAWASTQWVIRSDFHPELVGVVLALLAGWAGLTGRPRAMWLLAVLALTTREDVAYAVASVGLVVAVRGQSSMRAHGRALVIAATVLAAIVFLLVMPWLRDGAPSGTAPYYRWLGGGLAALTAPIRIPHELLAALTRPDPWFVVAGMVIATAGLPLLRPRWLLPVVPPLTALLLSGHPPQAAIILQYPLILYVPLLCATAMGGRRAMAALSWVVRRADRRGGRVRHAPRSGPLAVVAPLALVAAVIGAALPGAWLQGSVPPFARHVPDSLTRPPAIDALRRVVGVVPADAPVLADEGLVAIVAGRPSIGTTSRLRSPAPDAYVVIDRQAWRPSARAGEIRDRLLAWLPTSGRALVADDGRFQVWRPSLAVQTR